MSKKKYLKIVLKGADKVYAEFDQAEVTRTEGILESNQKPTIKRGAHEDFRNCFEKMVPHLLFSAGLAKPETFDATWFGNYEFLNDPRFDGVSVNGIVIVGKEQNGIKLLGTVTNDNGEKTAINGPIISLLDEGERKYPLLQIIRDNFKDLLSEADEFFSGKKYAPAKQQELQL